MSGQGDELTRFCSELPALRARLSGFPERRVALERAVEAVRDGALVADLLQQLGIAVSEGSRSGAPTASPIPARGHVSGGVYLCPLGRCQRAHERRPGDELPTCHLYGEPMRFVPDAR